MSEAVYKSMPEFKPETISQDTLDNKLVTKPTFFNQDEEELMPFLVYSGAKQIASMIPAHKRRPDSIGAYEGSILTQVSQKFAESLKSKGYDDLAKIVENDRLGVSYFYVMSVLEEKGELKIPEDMKETLIDLGYSEDLNNNQFEALGQAVYGAGIANAHGPFQNDYDFKTLVAIRIMNDPDLTEEEKERLLEEVGAKERSSIKGPDLNYLRPPETPEIKV